MGSSLRYWTDRGNVLDLNEVTGISQIGGSYNDAMEFLGFRYEVSMKNGTSLDLTGEGLVVQFKQYRGID